MRARSRSGRSRGWRRCAACGQKQPRANFAPSHRTRTGLDPLCRSCRGSREAEDQRRSCEDKNAYRSEEDALRAGTQAASPGVRLRAYPCRYGDHWHLTRR